MSASASSLDRRMQRLFGILEKSTLDRRESLQAALDAGKAAAAPVRSTPPAAGPTSKPEA